MAITTAPQSGGMPSGQIYGAGIQQPALNPIGQALFNVADTYLQTQTRKKIAERQLEGQLAGQTAEGLERVRNEETFLNQIFGKSATLQSAEQSFAKASVTDKFNDLQGKMVSEEWFKLKPDEFKNRVQDELSPLLATGDSELDLMMFEATANVRDRLISRYADLHHQYEQELSIQADNASLFSKLEDIRNSKPEDLEASKQEYFNLVYQIGNKSKAGLSTIYTQALAELQRGDSTTFDLIAPYLGNAEEFPFDVKQTNTLLNAKQSLDSKLNKQSAIRDSYGERAVVNKIIPDFVNNNPNIVGRGGFSELVEMFTNILGYPPSQTQENALAKLVVDNETLNEDASTAYTSVQFGGVQQGLEDPVKARAASLILQSSEPEEVKQRQLLLLGPTNKEVDSMSSIVAGFTVEGGQLTGDSIEAVGHKLDTYRSFLDSGDTAIRGQLLDWVKGDKPSAIMATAIAYVENNEELSSTDALKKATVVYENSKNFKPQIARSIKVMDNPDVREVISDFISDQGSGFVFFGTDAAFAKKDSPAHAYYLNEVYEHINSFIRENPTVAASMIENNSVEAIVHVAMRNVKKQGDFGNKIIGLKADDWQTDFVEYLFPPSEDIGYQPNFDPSDMVSAFGEMNQSFIGRSTTSQERLQRLEQAKATAQEVFNISPDMFDNVVYDYNAKRFLFVSEEIDYTDGYGGFRSLSHQETAELFKLTPTYEDKLIDINNKERTIRTRYREVSPIDRAIMRGFGMWAEGLGDIYDSLQWVGESAVSGVDSAIRSIPTAPNIIE